MAMKVTAWLMENLHYLNLLGKLLEKIVPKLPNSLVYNKGNIWGKQRDLPKCQKKVLKKCLYQEN